MKNLRWILFAFVAMMAWGACSDDETFAPPMIGGGEAANETLISLDTASTFMIERSIASEKGLQSVTLRDVTNDKVIDAVTSFTNPNQYAYSYAYKLPEVEELTIVNLILEVFDGDKTVKHSFTLTIRPKSMLNVEFVEEGNLITTAEELEVALVVTKGEAALKTLNMELDGVALEPVDISGYTEKGKNAVTVKVKGLTDIRKYNLKITAEDEWGVSESVEKTIFRKEPGVTWKDVAGVLCGEDELQKFMFKINEGQCDMEYEAPGDDKLYRFCIAAGVDMPIDVYCDFTYDDKNRVTEMRVSYWAFDMEEYEPMEQGARTYSYKYDAEGKVTEVLIDGDASDPYAHDIEYKGNRIVSYIDWYGNKVEIPYIEHEGETVSSMKEPKPKQTYTFSKEVNPFYMPELPPLVYENITSIFDANFKMENMDLIKYIQKWSFSRLFYNKYLTETVVINGKVADSFTNSEIGASARPERREQKITYTEDGEEVVTAILYYE